jgi:hypothetical protein
MPQAMTAEMQLIGNMVHKTYTIELLKMSALWFHPAVKAT